MSARGAVLRWLAGSLALTAACSSGDRRNEPEPRLRVPAANLAIRASIARPLRFGTPSVAEVSSFGLARDPGSLRVRFVLVPRLPGGAGTEPLEASIRTVLSTVSGELELRSTLANGGVTLDGPGVDELCRRPTAVLAASAVAALPSGVSVQIALRQERPGTDDPGTLRSGLEALDRIAFEASLIVRRGPAADQLEVALELAGARPSPAETPATIGAPVTLDPERLLERSSRERHDRELLSLAPFAAPSSSSLGWVVPSPFPRREGEPRAWLLLAIEVSREPDPGQAAEHARALEELEVDLGAERSRLAGPTRQGPVCVVDAEDGRAELPGPTTRDSLARIARRTGATLVLDAAVTFPDGALASLGLAVEKGLSRFLARSASAAALGGLAAVPVAAERTLGWELDLCVIETLLAPGFDAAGRLVLERRFGAAFSDDFSDSAEPILWSARRVRDSHELEGLVLKRNLLALDETRPSLRVRAARYLETLDLGLEGYDPLAGYEERHAAASRVWARLVPGDAP